MSSRGDTSDKMKYVPDSLRWLMAITGVLIVIGCLNIYSSTYYMNIAYGVSAYKHVSSHILYLLLGIVTAVFIIKLGTNIIRGGAWMWALGTLLLLILVKIAGVSVNGANRWLVLGPVSVQPSEIAKVAGIIWTASCLAKRIQAKEKVTAFSGIFNRPRGKWQKKGTLAWLFHHFKPILWPAILSGVVLTQPDMGTAAIILLFPGLLYILAGMPKGEILFGLAAALIGGYELAHFSPYRASRMAVLWDPFSDPDDLGYQIVRSITAVGSGGFWGQGPGEGVYKFLYLPEQHTDFAYAVFSQEYGFVGSVGVMALFMGFLVAGFLCAGKLKQTYESLLVYGLTLLVAVQGIINMAMVIGCFPVTGIPLPFISYGGTSLVINIVAVGLIWGTVVSGLEKSDMKKRKELIMKMEGRGRTPIHNSIPRV